MKMWLNELNDYYKFSRKVKIEESNYFGFDAVHFIRDFQRFCNLPTTGAYDAKTHEMVEWKYFNMEDNFRIESKIALAKSPKAVSDAAERQRIDRIMGTSRKWK